MADVRGPTISIGWALLLAFMTNDNIVDAHSAGVATVSRHTWTAAGLPGDTKQVPAVNARAGWVQQDNGQWHRDGLVKPLPVNSIDDVDTENRGTGPWLRGLLKRNPARSLSKKRSSEGVRWTTSQ